MRFGVALDLWCKGGEDDKDTADHATPPVRVVWNAATVKQQLVELCEGDKSKAAEVWKDMDGDSLDTFGPSSAAVMLSDWEHAPAEGEREPE